MTVLLVAGAVLLLCCFLCLYRLGKGPTAPDRAVAMDILGTLVVGFCCLAAVSSEPPQDYLLNIAIAWALVSFIGAIALAKFLEGKAFDE